MQPSAESEQPIKSMRMILLGSGTEAISTPFTNSWLEELFASYEAFPNPFTLAVIQTLKEELTHWGEKEEHNFMEIYDENLPLPMLPYLYYLYDTVYQQYLIQNSDQYSLSNVTISYIKGPNLNKLLGKKIGRTVIYGIAYTKEKGGVGQGEVVFHFAENGKLYETETHTGNTYTKAMERIKDNKS